MDDNAGSAESYEAAQRELDRLLNDPDVTFDAARVWALLATLTVHDVPPQAATAE
jgi:hypothetical protein